MKFKVEQQHSKQLLQIVHLSHFSHNRKLECLNGSRDEGYSENHFQKTDITLFSESEEVDEVADDRDYSPRNKYQEPETKRLKFQYIPAFNETTAGDPLHYEYCHIHIGF